MKPSIRLFLFLLVIGLLGIHRSANAATFVVDRTDDTADSSARACTPAANDCSLRGAMIRSNNNAGADTITLPTGTYALSLPNSSPFSENEAADGDLDIRDDLTVNGANTATTIIDGGALDRVFHIPVETSLTVAINDLTVTNGQAEGFGGGFAVEGDHTVTLNRLLIQGNRTVTSPLRATLNNRTGDGGGIWVGGEAGATLTINRSTISGNATGDGQNASSNPDGGGHGGGLYLRDTSGTISNSTIAGNKTGKGGNAASAPGGAGGNGGGLILDGGTVTLNNDTLTENTTGEGGSGTSAGASGLGGGIHVTSGSTLNIRNTLLAKNTVASGGSGPDCFGSVSTKGFNIVTNTDDCTGITDGDLNDHVVADPKLDPLGLKNNGGPTSTIALLLGSPAIDAGDDGTCRKFDQRGLARPQGAHCDIGAFEKGTCGDKFLEPEEQCDDGNTADGDGCSGACVDEVPGADCGNGALESGEGCDDGNTANGDGCSSSCSVESAGLVCGNGTVEIDEECDDGNATDGDGCSVTCQTESGGTGGTTAGGGSGGGCSLLR